MEKFLSYSSDNKGHYCCAVQVKQPGSGINDSTQYITDIENNVYKILFFSQGPIDLRDFDIMKGVCDGPLVVIKTKEVRNNVGQISREFLGFD